MISKELRWVIIGILTFSLVQAQEIQGTPGVDYPNFVTVPDSSFKCSDQQFIPGFYADLEAQCQAYHYCSEDGQETFLCPVGRIFNQAKLACDAWYNFNCSLASQLYSSNSGPLLENAMKTVPLLIKIRNRAKNRLSLRVPATDIIEKITSLYDGLELDQASTEGSSAVNAEQNPDTNEDQGVQLKEGDSLDDILSRLEASIEDESVDGVYDESGDESKGASDNLQTNLFFDPVTEKYYVDPESENEWSQNSNDDQFGYYDRDDFAYKYRLAMQDAEESRDFSESRDPIEAYRMHNEETIGDKFSKGQMDLEQPFRRLRRKPIYTVIQEDKGKPAISANDDMGLIMDSEEDIATKSILVATDVSSESSAEVSSETPRGTYTMAPFDMEDLSRLHMTPLDVTERPMTSEEFEDAIITELIIPKIDKNDLRVLSFPSDQEQPNENFADSTSSEVQNDGYGYDEYRSHDQIEYSEAESDAENFKFDSGTIEEIDNTEESYQDERVDESGRSDDTFVVIPDESEIPEFSEVFDTSAISTASEFQDLSDHDVNEDASARDSTDFTIPAEYESQGVYTVPDPSQYRTPRYSQSAGYGPGQYFQEGYINPEDEESYSPYEYTDGSYVADQALGSEHDQYGDQAHDPARQYMYASPASYACQVGYTNCMYGPQTEYPYSEYYENPYVSNDHYGMSDVEESRKLPVSEKPYSSESPMHYMVQSDPNTNREQFEVNQNYEYPNLHHDQSLDESYYPEESLPDNSGAVLGNENVNQETYYVLGDDEATAEADPESMTEPLSLDNADGVGDVTGNQGETYYVLEDEEKVVEDDPEVNAFADVSEEIQEQQTSSQDKPLASEESSQEGLKTPSQTADSKDSLPSEENSLGEDSAESISRSTMDSQYTPVTISGSFGGKNDRNGDILLDSREQFGRNDETSKVLVSSHGDLPNMFLNNMAYSDLSNFGPHAFGSNLGQTTMTSSPTAFSSAKGLKRTANSVSPNVSKLSALQERIRSLKQGKFGAFKKYVSSGSKI